MSIDFSGCNRRLNLFDFSTYKDGVFPATVDLRKLEWSFSKNTCGTDGTYLKAIVSNEQGKFYFKASNYNSADGFYGVESMMEYIAYRVGYKIGIDVLQQNLVPCILEFDGTVFETVVCVSKDYRVNGVPIPIGAFSQMHGLSPDNPQDYPCYKSLQKMFLLDYIMYQRDRHESNIEYLLNKKTGNIMLAPLYDNGCSLIAPWVMAEHMISVENILKSGPVNNFIGYKDVERNLVEFCRGSLMPIFDSIDAWSIVNPIKPFLGEDYAKFIVMMLDWRCRNALEILNPQGWRARRS